MSENKLKDELIQEYINLQRLKMADDMQKEIEYQEKVLQTRMLVLGIPIHSLEIDSDYTITTIIQLKENVDEKILEIYKQLINNAFSNRCGVIQNSANDDYHFIFEGGENERPCLEVGVFNLKDEENFLDYVKQWHWLESDPDECCDILELFNRE